jgi:hypothetical protein
MNTLVRGQALCNSERYFARIAARAASMRPSGVSAPFPTQCITSCIGTSLRHLLSWRASVSDALNAARVAAAGFEIPIAVRAQEKQLAWPSPSELIAVMSSHARHCTVHREPRCTSGRKIGREDFLRRRLELGNKPAAEPGSGDTLIAIFADISTT